MKPKADSPVPATVRATVPRWFCIECQAFVEVEDAGDSSRPRCCQCKGRNVEVRRETMDPMDPPAPPAPKTRKQRPPEFVLDAKPVLSEKRLDASKRDLKVLAASGYFFCDQCGHVSEPKCPDCGSRQLLPLPRSVSIDCVEHQCPTCNLIIEPLCCLCEAPGIQWNAPVPVGEPLHTYEPASPPAPVPQTGSTGSHATRP